jgi:hypothetical protein
MRICDLHVGPPSGRVRLADRLEEVARQLRAMLAERQEADVELEALRTSATWLRDLVLDGADGSSSLAASLTTVMKLLEGHIDAAAANGSARGPGRHWLPPCHISWSWKPS